MKWILILIVVLPGLLLVAGQLGLLKGRPLAIGVKDGRLAPVRENYPNAVSSQASSSYHRIEPIRINGDPQAAFQRLQTLVRQTPGVKVVEATDAYLRAECQTAALKFVDDLELLLDAPAGLIQVRSASRLGRKDFGVNRARVEALRRAFQSQPGAS